MNAKDHNISQELFETIERYVINQMTENERALFEKDLNNNTTLQKLVNEQQTLFDAIEEQSFKDKMDAFHSNINSKTNVISLNEKKPRFSIKTLFIAASVVVLLGLGSYLLFNQNTNQILYSKYFSPDPGLPTVMGNSSNYTFYDAMVNYKHKEYKKAIDKWELQLASKPKNDTLNYFLGMAEMANKQVEKAIPYLETVSKLPKSTFKQDAHYYLGLAYLKKDNVALAKKHLEQSNTQSSKDMLSELKD